jgi:hypothetical protein
VVETEKSCPRRTRRGRDEAKCKPSGHGNGRGRAREVKRRTHLLDLQGLSEDGLGAGVEDVELGVDALGAIEHKHQRERHAAVIVHPLVATTNARTRE